jgi:putative transposase
MAVSTSAYYAWCNAAAVGDKTQQDQALADKLRQIFTDNKHGFGSRRLSDRLKKQGVALGRFKTRRIMRELNLQVRYPKRFKVTTDSNHNETLSPNLLDRQLQVAKPHQVWTTDIT